MSFRIGALTAVLGAAALVAGGCQAPVPREHQDPALVPVAAQHAGHHAGHHTGHHAGHHTGHHAPPRREIRRRDRVRAQLATAAYQDVAVAEKDGFASSLESLGCFEDPRQGGMGVHYLQESRLDARVSVTKPEALVYELDADGEIAGLVAHEYIVPVDAWHRQRPPRLFGTAFHRHPSLPLYVLHAWLWKDNARGDLADWNPAVRLCPPGVPVFGEDRPAG